MPLNASAMAWKRQVIHYVRSYSCGKTFVKTCDTPDKRYAKARQTVAEMSRKQAKCCNTLHPGSYPGLDIRGNLRRE